MGLIYNTHKPTNIIQEGLYESCEIDYSKETMQMYIEALDTLMDLDESYIRATYSSIKHSNVNILSESTDNYIASTIKTLETSSLQMMELFDHQIKHIYNVFETNEKFLDKYEDYILNSNIKTFIYTGFWFTLDIEVPDTFIMQRFSRSIRDGSKSLEVLTRKDFEECENEMNYSTYPDRLRSQIIRSDIRQLDVDDYHIELYKAFRDGKQNPMNIALNKRDIIDMMAGIRGLKQLTKEMLDEKESLRKEYRSTISYLSSSRNNINRNIYRNNKNIYDDKALTDSEYNRYLMLMSRKAQLHLHMYNIAYGEKLVAIRDYCKQSTEIILKYIEKGDNI